MDKLERVIVGNVVLHGSVIRRYLKKSCYWLEYDSEKETIFFWANDSGGGEVLFEVRNASHENAVKLAEKLGLDDRWYKGNPILTLYHDGSAEAESFRMEMLKLGLPFRMFKGTDKWEISFGHSGGMHTPSAGWKADTILNLIRDEAKRWEKELNSTP